MGNVSDAELSALAALVQCRFMAATMANQSRLDRGLAVAYGEDWSPPELDIIESELRARGIIPVAPR